MNGAPTRSGAMDRAPTAAARDSWLAAISFVSALRIACDTWSCCALPLPGALPARLKTMHDLFTQLVLPDRRRSRRYPRAVKTRMSNFPRKRTTHAVS